MSNSFYQKRYCRTKRQSEVLTPLLPSAKGNGTIELKFPDCVQRKLMDNVAWRDLHAYYGNGNSIYHRFRQWCAQNVFMVTDPEKYLLVQIDSTFVTEY